MNTKVALLPRILPGLFHLPPASTASGYRMPHERYLVYAAAFSAVLHVAVLYGVRPGPITHPVESMGPVVLGGDAWKPDIAELKLEEEKVETKDVPEKPVEVTPASGEERATLAEVIRDPTADAIVVNIDRYVNPVLPNTTRLSWVVPSGPPPAARPIRAKIFDSKDLDEKPAATNRIPPRYPAEMRRNGIEGVAVLRFIVDSHGEVTDVEVVRADYMEFGKAAADAMIRWRFKPGMKNGRRVDTRMEMPMSFTLEKRA